MGPGPMEPLGPLGPYVPSYCQKWDPIAKSVPLLPKWPQGIHRSQRPILLPKTYPLRGPHRAHGAPWGPLGPKVLGPGPVP